MTVSTTSNKASHSGTGSQTVFPYTFKIFADADLKVIIRAADGTESPKDLTTHYTVSGAGTENGGNVTFTTGNVPTDTETVVIQRKLSLTQGTDYVANDPFPAESHEDALDRLTFITQQIQEEVDRSIKASVTNTFASSEFTTSATDRANKVFAFDSSGNLAVTQELGTFKGTSATTTTSAFTVRDIVKSTTTAQLNNIYICVADSVAGDTLTDTDHFALLVDAVSAAASQTAAANSATAAASSATAAAGSLTTFQGQYHGAASSDPSSNLDAGDLYFKTDGTGMKVYTGSAWVDVKPSSSEQTNINTVAAANSEIAALAASAVIADMALLADSAVIADMALLANTDVIADMNTLATSDIVSDLNTLATSDIVTDLNILATSANVTNMATLGASGVVANIATVAGVSGNVTTVANNISGVNSFAERYRVGSSDPTSSLDEGDLAYNSTSNVLKYYDGSSWQSISPGIGSVADDSSPQLGGDLDVVTNAIVSTSNRNIAITPNGSGSVIIDGLSHPQADGSAGQFLKTDGSGQLSFATPSGGLSNVVEDTSPQLGGNLDLNSNNITGTGNISTTGSATFTTADNNAQLTLTSTDTDANSGPRLDFIRNPGQAGADNDFLSAILHRGYNDAGTPELITYAEANVQIIDASDGSEDARFYINTMVAGSGRSRLNILPSETVFNDDSVDVDFRVESNGNANMLFVDAGNDRVGIGTNSPAVGTTLDVSGNGGGGAVVSRIRNIGGAPGDDATLELSIATASEEMRILFTDSAGTAGQIVVDGGDNSMAFETGTTERMRIDSSGFVGLGTSAPKKRLHILDTTSDGIIILDRNGTSTDHQICFAHHYNTGSQSGGNFFGLGVDDDQNDFILAFDANSQASLASDKIVRVTSGGDMAIDGSYASGGADYAEYFEWSDGNSSSEDRRGYSVVLDGNKVRKATADDAATSIIGVVSATPAYIGDSAWKDWQGKYEKDDYGNVVQEAYTITSWDEQGSDPKVHHSYHTDRIPEGLTAPSDAVVTSKEVDGKTNLMRPKEASNYDASQAYVPRENRVEWDAIGLMGKLRMRKGQPTGDRWLKLRDISDSVEEWLVR